MLGHQTKATGTTMTHSSLRTIHDEHSSLAAMLRSLTMMLDRGPGDKPEVFFDVLRAMLFYIDEVPERQHHPKESNLLFPRVARKSAEAMDAIQRLERDHIESERGIRELQHMLLAWELLGDSRRDAFTDAAHRYADAYLEHMRMEEQQILPLAERILDAEDWAELDAAFAANRDPLGKSHPRDPVYDRLFTRIVMQAPEPIGLGAA
jgi:hemerythrin-like domain-containing protein